MTNNLSAFYPFGSIAHLKSLAKVLDFDVSELKRIAISAPDYYLQNSINKKGRITYRVLQPLKKIQTKIKINLLDKVTYPNYLHAYTKKHSPVTNAKVHLAKKILVNEDIEKYFDNCTEKHVFNVWKLFFKFPSEIALILTSLTTLNGRLPQGASTSPCLSNLIFWKYEPALVKDFITMGLTYTRYGDDISISSSKVLSKEDMKNIISKLYGMLFKNNLKPKRKKHKISTSGDRMLVNGQIVNGSKVSLGKNAEGKDFALSVRAAIHKIDSTKCNLSPDEFFKNILSILGKINRIAQYNKNKSAALKRQLYKAICS